MRLDGFGIFVEDMPTMIRFYRDAGELSFHGDIWKRH